MAKTYKGKSMAPGGGGRFAKLTDEFELLGKSPQSAKALAAGIGRKKYGKTKMHKMALRGRER